MARSIIPRLVRGVLYFQIADVLFPTFAEAACAWAAAVEEVAEMHQQGGAS